METLITTVESSVHSPSDANRGWNPPHKAAIDDNLHQQAILQTQTAHLVETIGEKNTQIKRSDKLIAQIQAASDQSSKRAYTIMMHLSQHVERHTEEITILREFQGLRGVIRDIKSKLHTLEIDSVKRALQPR